MAVDTHRAAAAWPDDERGALLADLLAAVEDEDYLASLWEGGEVGIITLPVRRPQVLVFGDSHAYAGLDFRAIARAFPGKRVGAAAFPGGFIESFDLLLEAMDLWKYRPEILFFMTSPRMFMAGRTKAGRMPEHRGLLFDPAERYIRQWEQNRSKRRGIFGKQAFYLERLCERQNAAIEGLSDAAVDAVLASVKSGFPANWLTGVQSKVYTDGIDAHMDEIRRKLQGFGAAVFTAHIPESPYLEASHPAWMVSRYKQLLDGLGRCGPSLKLRAEELCIGNRYFLDRRLTPRFDYGSWRKGAAPTADLTGQFDADHMNLAGAHKFTAIMLDHFGLA